MSSNNNSSIPTDASKGPHNINIPGTQVKSKPIVQVSVDEAGSEGSRRPVKFPVRFSVPSNSNPRAPDCVPFPPPTDTVAVSNHAQGNYNTPPISIGPHAQAYHPYSRSIQGKGGAGPADHPPPLRRATTEPDHVNFIKNSIAPHSNAPPFPPAGYSVPPRLTSGPNGAPVLRRALTVQPGTFTSSLAHDRLSSPLRIPFNSHINGVSLGSDIFSSQTPRPISHEPLATVLIGSDRELPANLPPNIQTVPAAQARGQPVLSQELACPQMVQAWTSSTPTDPQLMSTSKDGRLTITVEDSIAEDPTQRLELILVPRIIPDGIHSNAGDGPTEALYFNQTETGLGTLLSDCITHSRDPTFMFGRGGEGLPVPWVFHLSSSPSPDYLTIEIFWPGYPGATQRWDARFRDRVLCPGKTIKKMFIAQQIALEFRSMYQKIQRNEQKLREGKMIDDRYLPKDGRWELGPNWITLDKIKLVSLQWAYGYTFQAQLAVSIG